MGDVGSGGLCCGRKVNVKTQYLNTDLDLTASFDLAPLTEALCANGMIVIHESRKGDAEWIATLESSPEHDEPEANATAILRVIEGLTGSAREDWTQCSARVFDIGYEAGTEPWSFNQAVSAETLGRLAETGASLRITIYACGKK
jgi:hypothetical protein